MTESSAQSRGPLAWLSQLLRIDAIRSVFSMVELKRVELFGLVSLAVIYAFAEGVGLSVLLPVLQFAETGEAVADTSSGFIWVWPRLLAEALGVQLTLVTLLVLAFIPVLLRQIALYANVWYSSLVSNRIAVRMRVNTYSAVMHADPDFFYTRPQGDFTGVILSQTSVAGSTALMVIKLLSISLQLLIYILMLSYLSWQLTIMAIAAGLLVSQVLRTNMVRTRRFGQKVAQVTQKSFAAIVERIALARLVKMRAQEDAETANVRDFSDQMAAANVSVARLGANIEVTADPLLMLSAFVTLYLGITVFGLRLAELGMLLYVLTRVNGKVREFNGTRQGIASGMPGLMMVRQLTDEAKAACTINDGPSEFCGVSESVRFDHVSFRYPSAEAPTLADITAEIPSGSFTAIVGRSGAGKSTLVELLPRLRDTTDGSVRFDGTDVREFTLSSLRRRVGYLTQDPMLFNDTLRANLLYGVRREVSDNEIRSALEQAYATFALELPDGLETRLGDRGVRFSGGERQRIALARVLLDDPVLLILDEPTSALDSESETYVQEALAALHGKKTIIVIAHRLATVVAADQLLVMEDGRIVQRGTHRDLVAQDGAYKQLFESQLLKE